MAIEERQAPTRQEVRDRAEILDSQLLTLGFGALMCPSASRLISESEADLREKYGHLYNTALTDLHRLSDTRLAWKILDDVQDLIRDVERACR